MKVVVPVRDGYDRWSELYDSDGNPLIALEEPHVDAILGDVSGRAIADIGCGTGRHAHRLAARGARVTAVDFSHGMLTKARAKPGAEQITWLVHDLAEALPLATGGFDAVVCALVVDHVARLSPLYAELGRIARRNAPIVVTVMHPALVLRGTQARFHDPATGEAVHPASVDHRICDYVMGALRAGLTLVDLAEHAVDASLVARAPRAERYLGWPMLLVLQLMRQG
jgi:malonyl-CoA O-methyltransferase